MKYLFIIAGLFVIYILCLGLFGEGSEDVKEASKLGMSVKRYQKYKEIDKKIEEYTLAGKSIPPNIFDEVKNMNEWRRFSKYMLEKSQRERKERLKNLQ